MPRGSAGISITLEGHKELNRALRSLKGSTRRRLIRPVIAKAARLIGKYARKLAPKRTGELRRSIKGQTFTVGDGVFAKVGTLKSSKAKYYDHIVHKGAKAHTLEPRSHKRKPSDKRTKFPHHKGVKATPYLRKGFEQAEPEIERQMQMWFSERLRKHMIKYTGKTLTASFGKARKSILGV